MTTLIKTAQCLCGCASLEIRGEASLSIACNCKNCQRRSGSAFGTIAYFDNTDIVTTRGEFKEYRFELENGNTNRIYFCQNCGSTVFFKPDLFPDKTGVSIGCFTGGGIPEPNISVWTESKQDWVSFPEHWHVMARQTS